MIQRHAVVWVDPGLVLLLLLGQNLKYSPILCQNLKSSPLNLRVEVELLRKEKSI